MKVLWLSLVDGIPAHDYWDQQFMDDLFAHRNWTPAGFPEFEHTEDINEAEPGIIIMLPAATHIPKVTEINDLLKRCSPCILCVMEDEGSHFPTDRLRTEGVHIWVQNPRRDIHPHEMRGIPVGISPHTLPAREAHDGSKSMDWFFAGQDTHHRRNECIAQLKEMEGGELLATPGFTQGYEKPEYMAKMAQAKVCPAPGGTETPDSLRLWECLELGGVPLADQESGKDRPPDYWIGMLGERPPFPLVENWMDAPVMTEKILASWPQEANRCGSWLAGYKRRFAHRFYADIRDIGTSAKQRNGDRLTVLMPTSVIPSHPDTGIIEETLLSIRERPTLDGCETIVMVDGLRDSQEDRRADYEEYKRRLIRLCRRWSNVWPMVFDHHTHQAGMTAQALTHVNTPGLLFVEHDTPLVGELPFEALTNCVLSHADVVRLHYDATIHAEHKHLFLSETAEEMEGVPLVKTVQWSQRPHLANTGFYRRIILQHFDLPRDKRMIEPAMHSVLECAWRDYGPAGWTRYKLYMYHPEGDIQRSTHLDGRGDDEAHEET